MTDQGKIVFEGKTAKGLDVLLRYPMRGDAPALLKFISGKDVKRYRDIITRLGLRK